MQPNARRVLVTGASGFIGAAVVRHLVASGERPYVLLRPTSSRHRLQAVLPACVIVETDLADEAGLARALAEIRPTHCIHLAWYAVPGSYHHAPQNLEFVAMSARLARAVADAGCGRFVGIGTCFEYDTRYGYLQEDLTPLAPLNLYAASKAAFWHYAQQFPQMRPLWLRLFYQYGPHESPQRLVPAIITRLLRDERVETTPGEQVRDYLHVDDVASAVCAAMDSRLTGAVNIGSGVPCRVTDLIAIIEAALGKTHLVARGALHYNPADPMFICASNQRLRQATGWQPRYTLQSGLQDVIEWWRAAQDDPRESPL